MDRSRVLLLLGLVIVSVVGVLCQDSCEPDCFGQASGTLVADPKNCTRFYICVGDNMPTDHAVPCAPGTSFVPDSDTTDTGCTGPAECTPTCSVPGCHLTCNGTLDMISDHKNCSLYYTCQPGGVVGPASCPADRPVFDGENCIKDETKCCTAICTAYCQPGVVQIPDPFNCHMYYICLSEGLPDPSLHFSCDANQHFDVQQGRCLPGNQCTPLCLEGTTAKAGGNTTPVGGTTSGGSGSTTTGGGGGTTGGSGGSTGGGGVTPTTDCLSSFTCTTAGYFPACQSCQPQYFHCYSPGGSAVLEKCTGDLVFNTDPDYPFCVLPSNCPYSPAS